jgi:hypothetical protein
MERDCRFWGQDSLTDPHSRVYKGRGGGGNGCANLKRLKWNIWVVQRQEIQKCSREDESRSGHRITRRHLKTPGVRQ